MNTKGSFTLFRALSIRNYRLYWLGQIASQVGYWLQLTALSYLVFRLTNSEFLLSAVVFCYFAPVLPLSTIAGTWIDRINKPKALFITQSLALLHALTLSILAFTNTINIHAILVLSLLIGMVAAFDMPLRQSTLIELIDDRKLLPNAIALNSLQFNVARVIGPSIAGLLILFLSEGWCFLLNALSYCSILYAILVIKWPPPKKQAENAVKSSLAREWKQGLTYLFGDKALLLLLFLLSSVSLTFSSYSAFIPAIAKRLFDHDVSMQSAILACAGLGGVLGNLWLANLKDAYRLNHIIAIVGIMLTAAFAFLSITSNVYFGLFLFFIIGGSVIMCAASVNSLLQILVDQKHRGQVMGFYTASLAGLYPIGALIMGQIAEIFHLRVALVFVTFAGGCAVVVFIYHLKKLLPSINERINAL